MKDFVDSNWKLIGYLFWIILIALVGCVSVRVITGEDNGYEGSSKETTGIESNIATDSIK